MRALGSVQQYVLRYCLNDRYSSNSGTWYAGCGWVYGNVSQTVRINDKGRAAVHSHC